MKYQAMIPISGRAATMTIESTLSVVLAGLPNIWTTA